MDIQEYIESGILEQYVLGELDETQRAEVERLAAAHPEIRWELDDVQRTLDAYAGAHALTPPPGTQERVLASWQASTQPAAAPTTGTPAEAVVRPITAAPANNEASAFRLSWSMAAAVALLLLSAIGNLVLFNKWKRAENDLAVVQSAQARVASTMQANYRRSLESRNQELQVLRSDQYKTVALVGTPAAPTAKARVLYNPATRAVYVDVRQLPTPPAGKQYQLWALDKGKPVDAGVLAAATAAGENLQQMKDIASAQAFAMTVEPVGGSVSPTLSTMTVLGKM